MSAWLEGPTGDSGRWLSAGRTMVREVRGLEERSAVVGKALGGLEVRLDPRRVIVLPEEKCQNDEMSWC